MRIAQVAPLFERVPPRLYGGTERIVAYLTDELLALGHDVTLFASGDSITEARLVPVGKQALRLDGTVVQETVPHILMLEQVAQRAREFDVVHFHTDHLHYPLARRLRTPHVTTLHGRLDHAELQSLYREFSDIPVISVSKEQQQPLPHAGWSGAVLHGLPADLYRQGDGRGGYLAFLGRLSPEKRPDRAIEIARCTGIPLRIAAKVGADDRRYFHDVIEPLLADPLVEFIGEIGEAEKQDFLGNARALLFPIDWSEPFGMVMIEAMACGTPVVAWRNGAVPEVIESGVSGFIVDNLDDAVRATAAACALDRTRARAAFEERFTARRMALDYLRIYREVIAGRTGPAAEAAPSRPDGTSPLPALDLGRRMTSSDEHLIHIRSTASDDRSRVLKHGDTFAVCNRFGDIQPVETGDRGLYHDGTRHLSHLVLRISGVRPLLLSSGITSDNATLMVDMTNPELPGDEGGLCPQDTLHLLRSKLIYGAACHERLEVVNYGMTPAAFTLTWEFDADFRDVFEVRGATRLRRGRFLPPEVTADIAELRYRGLDERVRSTSLHFDPPPSTLDEERAVFWLSLAPGEAHAIELTITCGAESALSTGPRAPLTFAAARSESHQEAAVAARQWAQITSSNDQFNEWLTRSASDLRMMATDMPTGPYVYAGVPWFSSPFGRDGIITALETLTWHPALSAGVLRYLAATQATEVDAAHDAEPGKILHEARDGEMAILGEVPFRRYYGSVDATPLFVVLAEAYLCRTGDRALIDELWPHLLAALSWIEGPGDLDGDGFLEYRAASEHGLQNQGWKDSNDSVFHANGALANGPIALCEVQGYAFAARLAIARLARLRGERALAREQERRAAALRRRFDEAFWSNRLDGYALALDGDKRPCLVETSNPGHGLFTGIVRAARATAVAQSMLHADLFSGWGIRTLAETAPRFNPMSYHNGSVWPHDNALIARGLSAYGFRSEAMRIFQAQFDAARHMELRRMPELFCGFERRDGQGPTQYPVACLPQSWAAGAVFMLLDACLGLRVDAATRTIRFAQPALPPFLDDLTITGLEVGDARADVRLQRDQARVQVALTRATGPVGLVIE